MKHILKNTEPTALTDWRKGIDPGWNPGWGELSGSPIRHVVKDSLLTEQGYICCYCGIRIVKTDSHIEHFRPRHGPHADPTGEIDYANMHACCLPDTQEGSTSHCGMKKGSSDPTQIVSPLDPTCETRFSFGTYGTIRSAQVGDSMAENSIRKLGLDCDFLNAHRRKALEASGLFDVLAAASATEIRSWANQLMTRQADGMFTEFCVATAQVLRSYA